MVIKKVDYFTILESMALVFLKHARLEKAVMFIGGGSNGKSTFLDGKREICKN